MSSSKVASASLPRQTERSVTMEDARRKIIEKEMKSREIAERGRYTIQKLLISFDSSIERETSKSYLSDVRPHTPHNPDISGTNIPEGFLGSLFKGIDSTQFLEMLGEEEGFDSNPSNAALYCVRKYLKPQHLDDVASARAEAERCGFVLCSEKPKYDLKRLTFLDEIYPKGKGVSSSISSNLNVSAFCSSACSHRHNELHSQLSSAPSHMRPGIENYCKSWLDVGSKGSWQKHEKFDAIHMKTGLTETRGKFVTPSNDLNGMLKREQFAGSGIEDADVHLPLTIGTNREDDTLKHVQLLEKKTPLVIVAGGKTIKENKGLERREDEKLEEKNNENKEEEMMYRIPIIDEKYVSDKSSDNEGEESSEANRDNKALFQEEQLKNYVSYSYPSSSYPSSSYPSSSTCALSPASCFSSSTSFCSTHLSWSSSFAELASTSARPLSFLSTRLPNKSQKLVPVFEYKIDEENVEKHNQNLKHENSLLKKKLETGGENKQKRVSFVSQVLKGDQINRYVMTDLTQQHKPSLTSPTLALPSSRSSSTSSSFSSFSFSTSSSSNSSSSSSSNSSSSSSSNSSSFSSPISSFSISSSCTSSSFSSSTSSSSSFSSCTSSPSPCSSSTSSSSHPLPNHNLLSKMFSSLTSEDRTCCLRHVPVWTVVWSLLNRFVTDRYTGHFLLSGVASPNFSSGLWERNPEGEAWQKRRILIIHGVLGQLPGSLSPMRNILEDLIDTFDFNQSLPALGITHYRLLCASLIASVILSGLHRRGKNAAPVEEEELSRFLERVFDQENRLSDETRDLLLDPLTITFTKNAKRS